MPRPPDPASVSKSTTVQPRLWRSSTNRVFAGVLGGLAERLNVDPTMMRWFAAFATVFTGFMPGAVLYLILWAITSPRETPSAGA
ncbi:MAG TPA: PspC domain-containing protein [Gemmatimonadaceae bacterium]|nr:PspC domain-containing protein [Gemmatimonadaceae bacterium]